MQGKPADLVRSGVDFAEHLEQDETKEKEDDLPDHHSRGSSSRSSVSSKQANDNDHETYPEEEQIPLEEIHRMEATSKGKVKGSIIGNYLKSSGSVVIPLIIVALLIFTQFLVSFTDYWVSFWTK